jgi:hypothetical protein
MCSVKGASRRIIYTAKKGLYARAIKAMAPARRATKGLLEPAAPVNWGGAGAGVDEMGETGEGAGADGAGGAGT